MLITRAGERKKHRQHRQQRCFPGLKFKVQIHFFFHFCCSFCLSSVAYQTSLVEAWFVFQGDLVESNYPRRNQPNLRIPPKRTKKDTIRYLPYPNSAKSPWYRSLTIKALPFFAWVYFLELPMTWITYEKWWNSDPYQCIILLAKLFSPHYFKMGFRCHTF